MEDTAVAEPDLQLQHLLQQRQQLLVDRAPGIMAEEVHGEADTELLVAAVVGLVDLVATAVILVELEAVEVHHQEVQEVLQRQEPQCRTMVAHTDIHILLRFSR